MAPMTRLSGTTQTSGAYAGKTLEHSVLNKRWELKSESIPVAPEELRVPSGTGDVDPGAVQRAMAVWAVGYSDEKDRCLSVHFCGVFAARLVCIARDRYRKGANRIGERPSRSSATGELGGWQV